MEMLWAEGLGKKTGVSQLYHFPQPYLSSHHLNSGGKGMDPGFPNIDTSGQNSN